MHTPDAIRRQYSEWRYREKDLNRWQSDLRKVATLTKDSALASLISNPKVTGEEKAKTLSQRLGEVNPLAVKLALLLAAKGKLAVIDDIAEEYQALVDTTAG